MSLAISAQAQTQPCITTNSGDPYATGVGCGALQNGSGQFNTAAGYWALRTNTKGVRNSAFGFRALTTNTIGNANTAVGTDALYNNTTGDSNTATGFNALNKNTTGTRNTAMGYDALRSNIGPTGTFPTDKKGTSNTAVGWQALLNNTEGWQNTAVGESALSDNVTGNHNTAIGEDSLNSNRTGEHNTASGESSLYDNVEGNDNVAVGYFALNHAKGTGNIGIGTRAGCRLGMANGDEKAGSNNIYIGSFGDQESNVIRIGTVASGTAYRCPDIFAMMPQSRTYIAGIFGAPVTGGVPVYVDAAGQLGIQPSSRRFKEEIEPLNPANDKVLRLRPVSFRYKKTNDSDAQPLQYGLIAEEVAQIMPELVQSDKDGKPFAVNYQFLAPLLLATMQREDEEIQQQHALLMALKEENQKLLDEVTELRRATSSNTGGRP